MKLFLLFQLIQIGVHRDPEDEYAREMLDWWLIEKDVCDKFSNILVPRFKELSDPYTSIYRLPAMRIQGQINKDMIRWTKVDVGVLELNGRFILVMEKFSE